MSPTFKRLHLVDYFCLFICGVLLAIICGGVMNAINGAVSPVYFWWLFFYPSGYSNWIHNGLYFHTILEGMWFGMFMSTVFTIFVAWVSKASFEFLFSVKYMFKIAVIAFLCWFIGGVAGILIGIIYHDSLSYIVTDWGWSQFDRYAYFWVTFSIWGVYLGNIVALILGCLWFLRDWKAKVKITS